MVKPLYIVFFFFAFSLCEEKCVTLTKKEDDGKLACADDEKAKPIKICDQLGFKNGTKDDISLKALLNATINVSNSETKDNFSYLSPITSENTFTLKVCYGKPETREERDRRMLKNEGTNSLSNILPTAVDEPNQKLKDSLIMAI